MNTKPSSRRPAVGILTGSFHTEYSRRIAEYVSHALHRDSVDVYLFQGLDASRFLNQNNYVDDGFDLHYYSQFEYTRFLPLDVIVLSFGTISAVRDAIPLQQLLKLLPRIPIILLEDESEIPCGLSITVDNYVGMYSCVEHLIRCHGCRELLYLSGPKGVKDAEQRLSGYRDALKANGLTVREELVRYGNFTDNVDQLVEDLLDRFPQADAIVCANDEMAESAYRTLNRRGLVPGKDIAVTGFGNNPSSVYMNPPLTSVRQGYEQVSEAVAEKVRAILRGERPESVRLPAELVVRQSCGCSGAEPEHRPAEETRASVVMRYRIKNKQLTRDNMLSALMLRNLLGENMSIHSFFRNLGNTLHALGTQHSWIALLKEPLTVQRGEVCFLPGELRIHMIQEGDRVESFSRVQAPVLMPGRLDQVPRWESPGNRPTAIFPLFYSNVHYGVLAVSLTHESMLFHYALSLEIGTGLRYLYVALAQQEAQKAIEEQNRILDYSASHDALTGLYNRVGVMKEIYSYVNSCGKESSFVAVMADLDHLKQINDNFGHDAGDNAIRAASQLLRAALPEGSPLGRTGGDEFTALFLCRDGQDAEWFRRRVKTACRYFNEHSMEAWYEDVSVGCVTFRYSQAWDIPELLKLADADLYEDKKHRRSNVIREQEGC